MSHRYEYTLTFRGDVIHRWKSVYDMQHVVVGYAKPAAPMNAARIFKTQPVAVKELREAVKYGRLSSGFVVKANPGTNEIVDLALIAQEGF